MKAYTLTNVVVITVLCRVIMCQIISGPSVVPLQNNREIGKTEMATPDLLPVGHSVVKDVRWSIAQDQDRSDPTLLRMPKHTSLHGRLHNKLNRHKSNDGTSPYHHKHLHKSQIQAFLQGLVTPLPPMYTVPYDQSLPMNTINYLPTITSEQPLNISTYVTDDILGDSTFGYIGTDQEPDTKIKEDMNFLEKHKRAFEQLDRTFYGITFRMLSANSAKERRENGISFVQSGLFLYLILTAISTAVDDETRAELETVVPAGTDEEKMEIIRRLIAWLPESSNELKLRWSTRLVLGPRINVSQEFIDGPAAALHLYVNYLNRTDDPFQLTNMFNTMILNDSKGSMHHTFDIEELSDGVLSAILSTFYIRSTWRTPPTVLNDTRLFHDHERHTQSTRMLKINDVMGYADLRELDAEAIEIKYSTPGLSLLMLVPRGTSLRPLSEHVRSRPLDGILARLQPRRLAVSMPLYTLRMTLLLPSKLRAMGISKLVPDQLEESPSSLKLSHAVQRLMFWVEAGRLAYKDDGLNWDPSPEAELLVDRPYVFFVRWRNVTLVTGNFVL